MVSSPGDAFASASKLTLCVGEKSLSPKEEEEEENGGSYCVARHTGRQESGKSGRMDGWCATGCKSPSLFQPLTHGGVEKGDTRARIASCCRSLESEFLCLLADKEAVFLQ